MTRFKNPSERPPIVHQPNPTTEFRRRDMIAMVSTAAFVSALPSCRSTPEGAAVSSAREATFGVRNPLYNSSVVALAEAVRAGELSAEELLDTYLTRIEEVNPSLNAVVQLRADEARAEARAADTARGRGQPMGPLHGVPMTIKDSLDTAGVITTGGTKGRESFVP